MTISAIIPTCEAADSIEALIQKLQTQSLRPDEIIVVDSESQDGTAALARQCGVQVLEVKRSQFDHGGTRDLALRASTGDIVLFLTQDATPVDDGYIEALVRPFADARVAAASGRQVARPAARAFEKAVREYRYPECDRTWDASDVPELGIRSFQLSDVCAAYRRSAYEAVGGFESPLLTNEDMLIAADFLEQGYRLAYCSQAAVWHSHNYTLAQEYRRNRLIGRFMQRYGSRMLGIKENAEGLQLVKQVVRSLLRRGKVWECCCFAANCAARILGNRAGRRMERKAEIHAEG